MKATDLLTVLQEAADFVPQRFSLTGDIWPIEDLDPVCALKTESSTICGLYNTTEELNPSPAGLAS